MKNKCTLRLNYSLIILQIMLFGFPANAQLILYGAITGSGDYGITCSGTGFAFNTSTNAITYATASNEYFMFSHFVISATGTFLGVSSSSGSYNDGAIVLYN